jgi:hypothetical protein
MNEYIKTKLWLSWSQNSVLESNDMITLNFYSASSLKQESAGRYITLLTNILILSKTIFALTP